ncbi:alpha/beta fold hydrolase [Sphingomonas nostoxanthinifaciens]|uniref:alpha/beta fold hydrolase n=1 Tax=Sphingomonas nostoxanthinifaciens TaxID=2872652 RepID=UPI001CC2142E|nr:alpha/beta hydrolase [Sphingomonas nostoxanthinifaciens]UAK24585.1 alpha/beta hydrolase [Sphingomonas nostoxanthinifaciens]
MTDYLDRPGLPRLAVDQRDGAGPTIVFLPGYGSDMTGSKATALDAWAEAEGLAMLRFDYRGCGASEGVFGAATLDDWRDDVLDAIDALTTGPLVLVGSSMGGWLMLLVALERRERVAGLVGLAAAPDFTDWGYDDDTRAALAEDGLFARHSAYSDAPQITTQAFWQSGQANLLLGGEIAIDGPVRLLHGLDDAEVPPSIAFRLGRALRSADVQTILVKGGDHRLSRPQDLGLLCATVRALVEAL